MEFVLSYKHMYTGEKEMLLMSHQKDKKTWLKWTITYVIFLVCVFGFYYISQNKYDFKKQYFQLVDIEDLHDRSYISNLYSQSDLITRLEGFAQELKNNNNFIFIEFSPVGIEFIGKWNKPTGLAENPTSIDQTTKINDTEVFVTSVEGLMLDQISLDLYSLDVSDGELFSDEDFVQTDNKLPLLLGSDFKDYYSIGDTIPLLHYGEEWIGVIKGFLKEDEQITQDTMIYHLDSYVLVPSFESTTLIPGFDDNYQKQMHHSKIQGYVILNNKEEYSKAKKEIKALSKKYNLSYQLLRGY